MNIHTYKYLLVAATTFLVMMITIRSAHADLRVMATGDSHTTVYAQQDFGHGNLISRVYEQRRDDATQLRVNFGGITTQTYINDGRIADVLAQDPDVIQLLLGTNDSANQFDLATYSNNMTAIINAFTGYTNGRGQHPVVVVATVMPLIAPDPSATVATPFIESYNTWLRGQSQVRDDFVLIDFYNTLTSQSGWESYYSDGAHLGSAMTPYYSFGEYPAGYILLAEQFRDAALNAIPEPASLIVTATLLGLPLFSRPKRN